MKPTRITRDSESHSTGKDLGFHIEKDDDEGFKFPSICSMVCLCLALSSICFAMCSAGIAFAVFFLLDLMNVSSLPFASVIPIGLFS